MSRMKFGFWIAATVSMVAVSTSAEAQIGTRLPHVDSLTEDHALLPVFNGGFQKTKFEEACESSRQVWQLDAPCSICGNAEDDACCPANGDCVSDAMNEAMWHETDSLVATLPQCDCDSCDHHSAGALLSSTDQYCKQMAALLTVTLNSGQSNPGVQQRAIEAAMKMVAENTQSQAETRIAQLEFKHERSLAQYRQQIAQLTMENQAVEQYKSWLNPIYANQNRNSQQIKQLTVSNASMIQSIDWLRQKIVRPQDSGETMGSMDQPDASQSDAYQSVQSHDVQKKYVELLAQYQQEAMNKAEKLEIQNLRWQIEKLNRQLDQMTKPVRQAEHLEPIYTPDQPLVPLQNKYPK